MAVKFLSVGHFLIILTCAIFLNVESGFSQNNSRPIPSVIPPSPAAAELAKYITYPVDLSNGLVKISIPLYEIADGDIRIPITLDYHASGLKANIRSNDWLGDGWSLNTGPSLSRNINGGPDELFYYYDMIANSSPTYQQLNLVVNQEKDIALDEFHYSLLSNSGRLYFKRIAGNQLRPVTIPVDPIKVSLPVANSYSNLINITDTKGLQYSFGGTDNKFRDLANNQFGVSSQQVPTAWKINGIYSPLTNRTVSFDYSNNVTEIPYYRKTDAVTILADISCQCTFNSPVVAVSDAIQSNQFYTYNPSTSQLEPTNSLNVTLPPGYSFPMQGVETTTQNNSYIKKITYTGGYVVFTKNEGGKNGLTSIRVYNNANTLVKQVEFIQSTSGFPIALKLDEIKISSTGSPDFEKYSFLYNGSVVNKDTRSVDKWGYYNGANNTTLVPPITTQVKYNNYPNTGPIVSISIPGANREPNETAMQVGVLTGIIYPTGGRTNFIYEAHRYLNNNGVVKLAGGLRVKQVQDVNDSGNIIYKNYSYSTISTSVNGNGILNVIPQGNGNPPDDNFIYYSETNCFQFLPNYVVESSFKEKRWSDNSMVDLSSENGSSVSYPCVFETTSSDVAGTSVLGKTIHTFNVSASYPLKFGNTNIVTDSKDGWSKGNLQSTVVFKNPSDTVFRKTLSYSLEFGYGDTDNNITQWYAYKSNRIYGTNEANVDASYRKIDYTWKELSTGRNLQSQEIKSTYNNNARINETESFVYDSYGNVNQTTRDNSINEKEITTNMYAKEMVDQGRDPAGTYANMVSNNILSIPVEVKTYKNSILSANLLRTNTTNYAKFNNTFFAPNEITSKVKNYVNEHKTLLNSYDNYGNVTEVQTMNGPKTSYKWGYKEQYPIAEAKNSALNEIYSQNFEEPELGLDFEANVIYDNTRMHTGKYSGRIINPNATEFVSHSSKRLNISLTAPKKFTFSGWVYTNGPSVQLFLFMMKAGETGYNTYYDHMQTTVTNKWVYMKKEFVVPADVVQMFLRLDNNAAGTVWFDDLRIQPSDAAMSTYTYEPLVGMTSAIDDSGKTVYYEYDTFQRLMNIKDQNGFIIKNYEYHYKP